MTARPRKRTRNARMKIGALEEASGCTRDTIRFYMREGLLHAAEKSGVTMAWYDRTHLERLVRVRCLRAHGLSLTAIARLLANGASDLTERAVDALGASLAALGLTERAERAVPDSLASDLPARDVAQSALERVCTDEGALAQALGEWARAQPDTAVAVEAVRNAYAAIDALTDAHRARTRRDAWERMLLDLVATRR